LIIRGLSGRAATIALTRLMNHGLILISPMILVRLLSVEQFGQYREFLLYVGLLVTIAAFGINSSLLRFVPGSAQHGWRFVNQAVTMTFVSSVVVTTGLVVLNMLFDGKLVGDYAIPVALYVFFYVNIDFWEPFFLAEKRSFAVLRYATGRLVARIVVVTTTAALTRDVWSIIIALICLEAVRLTISAIGWRLRARSIQVTEPPRWREHLRYAVPFGSALIVTTLNKSLGALFVAKMLGPVALAHYAIGTYLQPVVSVIRNSLSDVVLPEMVSRDRGGQGNQLELWKRTAVVTAILLVAAGVLLGRFADVLVTTLFSEAYRPAVVIFQLYLLVFLREALDFGIPLRAADKTGPILHSTLIAIVINILLMLVLTPLWGALGAVVALVISRFIEGGYLALRAASACNTTVRELVPWLDLFKVLLAAASAGAVLYVQPWTEHLGLFGVILGGAIYMVLFVLMLRALRIPEVVILLQKVRAAPALVLKRLH
jgi:O-antigen/teichoic acid export membrane protein